MWLGDISNMLCIGRQVSAEIQKYQETILFVATSRKKMTICTFFL